MLLFYLYSMKLLFRNIKDLVQVREDNVEKVSGKEMKVLPTLKNAWLLVEEGKIADYGEMNSIPAFTGIAQVDVSGKIILPTWCDSHTHLVYAGNREGEFTDRINGLTYEEIANRGGGILNSAKTLQETSEEDFTGSRQKDFRMLLKWEPERLRSNRVTDSLKKPN
jgi:imidazolonepropionase